MPPQQLLVGAEGFEPPTLCSQSRCATRLRYAPTFSDCIAEWLVPPTVQTSASRMDEPFKQPDQKQDWNSKNESDRACQQEKEHPILPGVTTRLAQMTL